MSAAIDQVARAVFESLRPGRGGRGFVIPDWARAKIEAAIRDALEVDPPTLVWDRLVHLGEALAADRRAVAATRTLVALVRRLRPELEAAFRQAAGAEQERRDRERTLISGAATEPRAARFGAQQPAGTVRLRDLAPPRFLPPRRRRMPRGSA